ncbi:MAG: outer membrane lipoprotein-sorting protein [Granulosicoccus sp.]
MSVRALKHTRNLSFVFAGLLFASVSVAQTPEERGLEIATMVQAQDDGFTDSESSMTMTLINRSGKKSTRRMRSRVLEVQGDGDKSMSIFDEPADVKGTASLTHSHATEADEQWLYLPALKRVKRISSKNKSGPFMGSEFAFEDISSQEVDKYSYKYLGDDELDGVAVYKVEAIPAYKHSGYTRLVNWIDQDKLVALKVEYFDRKNSLLKTLTISDYQRYLDQFWRAGSMHMQNEQTGKSTILEWSDYKFKTGLTDKDFDSKALKRIR